MKREKEEVYSKSVKAGRRTYFFDVKESNLVIDISLLLRVEKN